MLPAIEIGFELDRRWHWLRGEMEDTKKPARDPARLRSKRILDLADAEALLERDSTLAASLSEEERALLAHVGV